MAPFASASDCSGNLIPVALEFAVGLATAPLIHSQRPRCCDDSDPIFELAPGVAMRFILLILAGLTFCPQFARADSSDGRLDFYFIDVEGGAATLIITPVGESMLIDSGYPDNNSRDLNRILEMCRKQGATRLDHAVVSHWHRDHYGNHAALASYIKVGTFWDRGIPDLLREDKQFESRIADYRSATQNQSKRCGLAISFRSNPEPRRSWQEC